MNIEEKMKQILTTISEIRDADSVTGDVLLEGYSLSLKILEAMSDAGTRDRIDFDYHLEVIAKVMGFSLNDLVKHAADEYFKSQPSDIVNNKEPDQSTMDFITSNMDDYEQFLARNRVKQNLEFLAKEL